LFCASEALTCATEIPAADSREINKANDTFFIIASKMDDLSSDAIASDNWTEDQQQIDLSIRLSVSITF
jgi:hypothetical protein